MPHSLFSQKGVYMVMSICLSVYLISLRSLPEYILDSLYIPFSFWNALTTALDKYILDKCGLQSRYKTSLCSVSIIQLRKMQVWNNLSRVWVFLFVSSWSVTIHRFNHNEADKGEMTFWKQKRNFGYYSSTFVTSLADSSARSFPLAKFGSNAG